MIPNGSCLTGAASGNVRLRVAACDDTLFPGARQVFWLRRDTGGLVGVRTSKEIIPGIVSLDAEQAGPQHLNHYARGNWTVESRLHWTRDVTFHEDAPRSGPVRAHAIWPPAVKGIN